MCRIYSLVVVAILILVSCQKTDKKTDNQQLTISVLHPYSNGLSQQDSEDEQIGSLRYYICDGGKVTVVSNDLAANHAAIKLEKADITSTAKFYMIANGELSNQFGAIGVGSDEDLFATLETRFEQTNGQIETIAMSASIPLGAYLNGGVMPVKLKRNMARFDLSIQQNVDIEVESITVSGLPTAGSVFENGTVSSENKATYTSNFAEAQKESVEGLFYCYERPVGENAAVAQIDVRYGGKLTTLIAPIGDIKRNSICRLVVVANMGSVSATVDVSGIEEGDNDNPPNTDLTFDIHSITSSDPGVSLSSDKRLVNLPYSGATVDITLSTEDEAVELKSVEGAIDNFTVARVNSAIGPTYTITTSPNTRVGADKRVVILNFTLPSDKSANVHQIMVSIENYSSLATVTIGALDWMLYNASGKDVTGYPLPDANADVRSMYKFPQRWQQFTGKIYQWGPRPGKNGVQIALYSWGTESYGHVALPNINGAIIGNPARWEGATVPCPDGWRLATHDDYQSIWPPHGTIITENVPVSYTTSKGNQCSAVIETFGGTYLNNRTGSGQKGGTYEKARNMIITAGATEILFPIGGFRRHNGAFKPNPTGASTWNGLGLGLGSEAYYWCADKSGNNFNAVGISNGVIQNNKNNHGHNIWYHQRCVRSKK